MGFRVDEFGNCLDPNDPHCPSNYKPGRIGITSINPIRSTPVNDVTAVGVTERFLPANIDASTKPSFVNSYSNGVVLSTGYLDTVARQQKVFQIDQEARNNGITVAEQLQRAPLILLALIPIGIFAFAKFLKK